MLQCHWKQTLGIECPGCGFQRSVLALFEGNFSESFALFPATIPIMFTVLFLILHLVFKFKYGARVLVISFSTSAATMLIAYGIKLATTGNEVASCCGH